MLCLDGQVQLLFPGPPSLTFTASGLSFMPLQTWAKVLAVSGVLTMTLALLGCLGALKELRCLLGLVSSTARHRSPSSCPLGASFHLSPPSPLRPQYFGMLLLLFATQITMGILIYTQRTRVSLPTLLPQPRMLRDRSGERNRQVGSAINQEAEAHNNGSQKGTGTEA